jgi:hypothetical protein
VTRSGAPPGGASAAAAQSNHDEITPSAGPAGEQCLACGHVEGHASRCGPDYLTQERVAISDDVVPTLEHILDKPMLGAFRHPDLPAAKRWQPPRVDVPPTTDEEREWVHDRLIGLAAERQARSDAHRERIRSSASWLGHQVRKHKMTLADGDARIDRLLKAFDPASVAPILLVPFKEATEIATNAFASTFNGGARD